jgi:hypothetical protein
MLNKGIHLRYVRHSECRHESAAGDTSVAPQKPLPQAVQKHALVNEPAKTHAGLAPYLEKMACSTRYFCALRSHY